MFLVPPGRHFGTLGLHVGGPGFPKGHQSGKRQVFNEFRVPFGCPVGPLEVRHLGFFETFLFYGHFVTHFGRQRGHKWLPTETILRRFGGVRKWKCGNDGFVYAAASFYELKAVPRGVLCNSMCAMFSDVLLGTTFSRFHCDVGSELASIGSSWGQLFADFVVYRSEVAF